MEAQSAGAPRTARAGRPWGPVRGNCEESNELAWLLRGWLDAAGISARKLRERLTPDHFGSGAVPSEGKLYAMLAGDDLGWDLVEAVAELCFPADSAEETRERCGDARRLWLAARDHPTSVGARSAGDWELSRELSAAKDRIIETQEELGRARQALQVSEASRFQAERVGGMLFLLLGWAQSKIDELSRQIDGFQARLAGDPGELSLLEQLLARYEERQRSIQQQFDHAVQERDTAQQVVDFAARRIQTLEAEVARLQDRTAGQVPPADTSQGDGPEVAEPGLAFPNPLDGALADVDRTLDTFKRVLHEGHEATKEAAEDIGWKATPGTEPGPDGVVVVRGEVVQDAGLSATTPDNPLNRPDSGQPDSDVMRVAAVEAETATHGLDTDDGRSRAQGIENAQSTVPAPDAVGIAVPSPTERGPTKTRGPAESEASDGAPVWRVMLMACVAQFAVVLGAMQMNVALPSLQESLDLDLADAAWPVNAYGLGLAGLLLSGRRATERYGARPVFLAGVALFGLASLACVGVLSPELLLASRAAQGCGAALVSASAMSIAAAALSGRGLGRLAAATSVAVLCSDAIAGLITGQFGWRALFLVNFAVAVSLFSAGVSLLRKDATDQGITLGILGTLALSGALVAITFAFAGTEQHGWGSVPTLLSLAAGVVCSVGFVACQRRSGQRALVPLARVRSLPLGAAVTVSALLHAALLSEAVFVSLYAQNVLGYGPLAAGLVLLVPAATVIAVSMAGPRPASGEHGPLFLGLFLIAAGLAWLSRVSPDGSFLTDLLGPLEVTALGLGLVPARLAGLAGRDTTSDGLPQQLTHVASLAGGAFGLAALTSVAVRHTEHTLADQPQAWGYAEALSVGYARVLLISAVLAAGAAFAILPLLRRRPPAAPTASLRTGGSSPTGTGG
ncbi:MFS transporter [Streptomyces sp. CA-135486]|uniref:MFS transporter n=1 Tax=Streptomyces sp. CA-135486 TaxID=3240049 RepID=UPI003D8F2F5F